MFEGDSVDIFAGKFSLISMGGRAVGLACADPFIVESMRCPDMQQKAWQTNAVVTNRSLIAKLSPSPSSTWSELALCSHFTPYRLCNIRPSHSMKRTFQTI
jgi:hypothetical protein